MTWSWILWKYKSFIILENIKSRKLHLRWKYFICIHLSTMFTLITQFLPTHFLILHNPILQHSPNTLVCVKCYKDANILRIVAFLGYLCKFKTLLCITTNSNMKHIKNWKIASSQSSNILKKWKQMFNTTANLLTHC